MTAPNDQPVGPMRPVEVSVVATPEFSREEFRRLRSVLRLPKSGKGFGLLHCVDSAGDRYTRMTLDVEYVRLLRSAVAKGADVSGIVIPDGKFPMMRRGWPDEWAGS